MSEPCQGRTAEELFRRSVRQVVASRRKSRPAWAAVRDHFGIGSSSAAQYADRSRRKINAREAVRAPRS